MWYSLFQVFWYIIFILITNPITLTNNNCSLLQRLYRTPEKKAFLNSIFVKTIFLFVIYEIKTFSLSALIHYYNSFFVWQNLQFKTFCIWTDLVLYCQCYQHFILDRAEHSFNNKHSRIDSHLSDSICVTETWPRYLLTVDDSICVIETWSRYLLTVDDSICVAETVWFVYYRLVWCKMSVCGIATLFLSSSVLMLLAAILLYTIYSSCIHTYNVILSVYL